MSRQDLTDILVVGDAGGFPDIGDTNLSITFCPSADDAVLRMAEKSIRIALVMCHSMEQNGVSILQHLRNAFFQEPVQIVAAIADYSFAASVVEYGADDCFEFPCDRSRLLAAVLAAVARLRSLIRVYGEREFFRKAAKQEEELSSKILDQHLVLKEAFLNIENINQDLEETNKQLERIARYDILSGLMNRGSLFAAMDTEIERATRTRTPLAGIMMDIDNFKQINDTFGHLHGDRVIAEIGRRLKSMLRKYDLAGRYGGEEFFIILPNTTLPQGYLIAERFREEMEKNPVSFSGDSVSITASFGIAQYRVGSTRDAWIERCDSYLYHAKETGKNKVVGE